MTIDIYRPELATEYRGNIKAAIRAGAYSVWDAERRQILSGTKKQILPCIFLWRYKNDDIRRKSKRIPRKQAAD